jgi:hypothetical protein
VRSESPGPRCPSPSPQQRSLSPGPRSHSPSPAGDGDPIPRERSSSTPLPEKDEGSRRSRGALPTRDRINTGDSVNQETEDVSRAGSRLTSVVGRTGERRSSDVTNDRRDYNGRRSPSPGAGRGQNGDNTDHKDNFMIEDQDFLIDLDMVLNAAMHRKLTAKAERLHDFFHSLDTGRRGYLTAEDLEAKVGRVEGLNEMITEGGAIDGKLTLTDFMTLFLGEDGAYEYEQSMAFLELTDEDLRRRKSRGNSPGPRKKTLSVFVPSGPGERGDVKLITADGHAANSVRGVKADHDLQSARGTESEKKATKSLLRRLVNGAAAAVVAVTSPRSRPPSPGPESRHPVSPDRANVASPKGGLARFRKG